MLELFTRHGAFDLDLTCNGDLDVDQHHTVEDVGIALGEAFDQALGDKRGILRAGYFLMTMDETLGLAAIDLSGRAASVVDTKVKTRLVGDLQSELVDDFFEGFARGARANVHVKTMYGRSNHHKIEAFFKAFARALRVACSRDKQLGKMLPSDKRTAVIAVIDYKAGNLTSVMKALAAVGAECRRHRRPRDRAPRGKDRPPRRRPLRRDRIPRRPRPDAGNRASASQRAFRSSESVSACSGSSQAAPKRPASQGSAHFDGRCERFRRRQEKFRTSDGTRWK